MFNESLDLAQEFPEFKEQIHNLKASDAHFKRLFEEYEEASKELHRIAEEIETPSDSHTEALKKKKLKLKDELFAMLKKAA